MMCKGSRREDKEVERNQRRKRWMMHGVCINRGKSSKWIMVGDVDSGGTDGQRKTENARI